MRFYNEAFWDLTEGVSSVRTKAGKLYIVWHLQEREIFTLCSFFAVHQWRTVGFSFISYLFLFVSREKKETLLKEHCLQQL